MALVRLGGRFTIPADQTLPLNLLLSDKVQPLNHLAALFIDFFEILLLLYDCLLYFSWVHDLNISELFGVIQITAD
jgi:hypothetical protein